MVKEGEMGAACGTQGGAKIFSSVLVGRPEGQDPFRRNTLKWEQNITICLTD